MDTNEDLVAVRMIEVLAQQQTQQNDDIIDNTESQYTDNKASHQLNDGEQEDEDDNEQGLDENEDGNNQAPNNDDQVVDSADADDIIIAEAVAVTQYSCKFCNRRFDSIDKVKNHYLLRHNNTKPSVNTTLKREPKEENESNNNNKRRRVTKKPAPRNYKIEIIGEVDEEELLTATGQKKRGRKPTGVKRKYPCDWPACNYVARHSVTTPFLLSII